MKLFKSLFEPINRWLWSFLCKQHLILFCSSDAPDPIDPGKSMGQYLFGKKEFKSAKGVTDPLLQGRLLESEATFRPLYTALELADIQTMAQGRKQEIANPAYQGIQREIESLQRDLNETKVNKQGKEVRFLGPKARKKAEARLRSLEQNLEKIPETLSPQAGLFDLLEDQSRRAGDLQREQLGVQREADVAALQRFAPDVVQAYRDADPFSTALAEEASARAMDSRLRDRGQGIMDSALRGASESESALQSSGMANINAIRAAAGAAENALQSSGLDNINAKREAASAAEQQLNKVGMSLSDLSPTEQEAILSGRGMEFASSTGELSALERRRAQQSSREASVARGRGMDQSAVYGEMEARMAEELNKREREIALGASLLGQQADMRLSRLGQGANILGQAEAMDAQRRAEQLQRQKFGASLLTQAEAINAQRRAEQLERQRFGSDQLRVAESMLAQRRAEELQNLQLGAGLIGRADQQLQGAFGINRQLAGDAGNIILGRPSAAIGLGSQMLGQAQQGAAGPMGPQLFDPNVGVNMALQQRGQDLTFQGMQAQSDAALGAGAITAGGEIANTLINKLL